MNESDQLTINGINEQLAQLMDKINQLSIKIAEYDREFRQLQKRKAELLDKRYTPSEYKHKDLF
jgi:flagellar hook-associated protein FlgK